MGDIIKEEPSKEATHEELCNQALKHYEEISDAACHWNSVVPEAIKYYRDNYREDRDRKKKPKLVLDVSTVVRCSLVGCKGYILFEDWESKTRLRFVGICDACGRAYEAKLIQPSALKRIRAKCR